LEVSGAVRPIYGSLGVKRLIITCKADTEWFPFTVPADVCGHNCQQEYIRIFKFMVTLTDMRSCFLIYENMTFVETSVLLWI